MDRLTFVAQVVAALAWPVTVLICVLLLKGPLASLAPFLRRLKYSDLELQFGREVADLKDAADAAALRPVEAPPHDAELWEELVRVASVRPRSAIRKAWQQVEETLVRAARSRNLQAAPGVWSMPMVLGALMLNAGVITDAQYNLLSRVRRLTTEAERAPVDSLAPEDAAEFVGLAFRLAASLPARNGWHLEESHARADQQGDQH